MINRVIAALKKYKSFLIVSHINLESDAIGSAVCLARLLISLGKRVIVCNGGKIPKEYKFLPYFNTIRNLGGIDPSMFEAAIVVDCSEISRIGEVANLIPKNKLILNIDHHIRNHKFAKINWIDEKASSCAELIYRIYKKMHKRIDKKIAYLFYAALVSDTGSFKYPNTSYYSHQMAADLLKSNLPVNEIYHNIYGNISFCDYREVLKVLGSYKLEANGKIIYFTLDENTSCSKNPKRNISDFVLDFARSIKDVEMAIIFKKTSSKTLRVSLRSKGRVDVSRFAKFFGGGGHRSASGVTISGKPDKIRKLILERAKKFF